MSRTLGQLVLEARAHLGDYSPSLSGTSSPVANTLSGTYTQRTVGDAIQDVRGILNDPMPSPVPATTRTFGDIITEVRAALRDTTPSGSGNTYSGTSTILSVGMVITEARGILNDPTPPYRYSDTDLYLYFGDALRQARRFRPDLFETVGYAGLPIYTPASANTLFPIDENYFTAFVQ